MSWSTLSTETRSVSVEGAGAADLREDLAAFHIAGDDEEDVVGRVAFAIVGEDVVLTEFVVNVRITDDGVAVGAARVGHFKQAAA